VGAVTQAAGPVVLFVRERGVVADDETFMRLAMTQGQLARGQTGDNPWVGCAIVSPDRRLLGQGFTQGPSEHHAEIAAAEDALERGLRIVGATLYSTLEPCSFHGRTPACAHAIVARGLRRVVVALRDPHPRVDGAGLSILRAAGVEVVEGVCESEVRIQLGSWIVEQHPHEVARHEAALSQRFDSAKRLTALSERFGVEPARIRLSLARIEKKK
jgi:diaminohydroxyphosphoribosylaminopyrimidine deaminase / 5-amino-6-(5-phosphoribosylamino)uracil reductase